MAEDGKVVIAAEAGEAVRVEEGKIQSAERGERSGLSPRQQAAVRGLACGRGMAEVGRMVGVSRPTLYRWMEEPEFAAEVNQGRARTAAMARAQLRTALRDAAEAVLRAVRNGDLRAGIMLLTETGKLERAAAKADRPAPTGPTEPRRLEEQALSAVCARWPIEQLEQVQRFHLAVEEETKRLFMSAGIWPPETPSFPYWQQDVKLAESTLSRLKSSKNLINNRGVGVKRCKEA